MSAIRLVRSTVIALALLMLAASASTDAGTVARPAPATAIHADRTSGVVGSGGELAAGPSQGRLTAGLSDTVCDVITNGEVRCWGYGQDAELGNGATVTRATPTTVNNIHDAVAVTAGYHHACALRSNGTIACWGLNDSGQKGNGNVGGGGLPDPVVGISTATMVAAGQFHTCALLANGSVSCWGADNQGQVGQVAPPYSYGTPMTVPGVSGAIAIATGLRHSCAALSDGTVDCWGDNSSGQLGATTSASYSWTPMPVPGLTGVKALAASRVDTCALLSNGTAKCWGDNQFGQLGNNAGLPAPGSQQPVTVAGLSGAVAITGGWDHFCALLATGQVECWGNDLGGQLGDSGTVSQSHPVLVPGVTAVGVDAGGSVTCARLATGSVACWGDNTDGGLGRGDYSSTVNGPGLVHGNLLPEVISAGGFHTCALTASETVKCWGDNEFGQLGISATGPVATPTTVPGLTGVIAVSAGTRHTCAVLRDGTARCWGLNDKGQLGNGDFGPAKQTSTPQVVSGLTGAEAISAGGDHTCALKVDRSIWCWGNNTDGEIGDGNHGVLQPLPAKVNTDALFQSVSAGSGHTCAVTTASTAWCWGLNSSGQVGNHTNLPQYLPDNVLIAGSPDSVLYNVAEIEARYAFSCAVLTRGGVYCWGFNGYDSVGTADSNTAKLEPGLGTPTSIGPSSGHGTHTCEIESNQSVWCWGSNDQGQLGLGATSDKSLANKAVVSLGAAAQVAVGFQHSCALLTDGTAMCWGSNAYDQLGSTATSPVSSAIAVTGYALAARVVEIDAGTAHTCAVLADATARCWGSNGSGRLGDGTTTTRTKPVKVSGLAGATAISAGGAHTCALLSAGTAKCWGSNSNGQIGDNTVSVRKTPTTVSGLSGAIEISAGANHTCALLAGGTVKCWGQNTSGQLGDGSTTDRHLPVTVKSSSTTTLTGVVAISAGANHTCAVLSNGTARCWGAGANGRLGDGALSNKPYATATSGVTTATAVSARFASISAGAAHTCARVANGTAMCWGAGGSGRLGNAATADHSTPVAVSGLSSVAEISAGGAHTCALLVTGVAKCWGSNAYGQLGISSTTSKSSPVTVSSLAGASMLSAGGNHTAALLASSVPRVWGLNSSGQVGDGTTTNRLTPHGVSGF